MKWNNEFSVYAVQFVFRDPPAHDAPMFVFQWLAEHYVNHVYPTGAYICECVFTSDKPGFVTWLGKWYIQARMLIINLRGALQLMMR